MECLDYYKNASHARLYKGGQTYGKNLEQKIYFAFHH